MPRSQRRRSTPSSPVKTKESVTEHRTRSKPRTRSRDFSPTITTTRRRVRNQLGPVEEEGETIVLRDPQLTRKHESSHYRATQDGGQRPPQNSRVPSIRATVHDNIPPAELQVESMVKHLAELNFRADEVLSQLDTHTNQELLEHLNDRHSFTWDDFNDNASRLESERQYYGNDQDLLNLDALFQELAAKNLPITGAAHVFTKANLALFFYRLLEAHPKELHNLIVSLTMLQEFPEIFTARDVPERYDDDFKYQTISVGLDILTQCFLFKAKRSAGSADFDYVETMQEVFYGDKDKVRDVSLGALSPTEERVYITSMEDILSKIEKGVSQGEDQSLNLAALEKTFPWIDFVAGALAWIRMRIEQIDLAIRQEGGLRAIKRGLLQSKATVHPGAIKRKSRSSRANQDFVGKISFLRNIDEDLNVGEADSQAPDEEEVNADDVTKANAERIAPQDSIAPSSSARILREIVSESPRAQEQSRDMIEPQNQDQDQDQVDLMDDSEPIAQEIPNSTRSPSEFSVIRPTQGTAAVLRVIERQTKEGNKENSPPPAQSPRTQNQRTTTARSTLAVPEQNQPSKKGQKRHRDDEDGESEEDAFESDQRHKKRPRPHSEEVVEPVNRQRRQPTGSDIFLASVDEDSDNRSRPSTQPPRQRPQNNDNRPGPSTQPAPASTQVRGHARSHSANPTRTPSSSIPPSSFHDKHIQVRQIARANTSLAAAVAPQPAIRIPQTRRPWTGREVERLVILMQQYGCGWAAIKKADERMPDPQLLERTQVQLKDKARNIKLDFLKAEVDLPRELQEVTISKSHKQMFKAMNIAYPGEEHEGVGEEEED